jgi:hypothetical protein
VRRFLVDLIEPLLERALFRVRQSRFRPGDRVICDNLGYAGTIIERADKEFRIDFGTHGILPVGHERLRPVGRDTPDEAGEPMEAKPC